MRILKKQEVSGMKSVRKLSNTKLNLYIRRTVFVLAIFLVSMFQNTPHLSLPIFGARAFLLIPLVICISMFEKDISATLMGVLAGALWDATLAYNDGFHAIFLMIISTVAGLLINYLMRNNLYTAMLISSVSIVLYAILHWLVFVVFRGVEGGLMLFVTFYMPSILYTFIFVPIIYFIMRAFVKKLKDRFPHAPIIRRP